MITPCRQLGLTLIELTVVLLILVAMAGLVVPNISGTSNMAECTATDATMAAIKNAIVGDFENPGYADDMKRNPVNMSELFNQGSQETFNPVTELGWRGPYLYQPFLADHADRSGNFSNASYVSPAIADGESVILDGYGLLRPIIIQNPTDDDVRLVSAGPDGLLDTAIADTSVGGDDRVLYLKIANPDSQLACNET